MPSGRCRGPILETRPVARKVAVYSFPQARRAALFSAGYRGQPVRDPVTVADSVSDSGTESESVTESDPVPTESDPVTGSDPVTESDPVTGSDPVTESALP